MTAQRKAKRKPKFQADLAPAEDRIVRSLKDELRVTPEAVLPRVSILWNEERLQSLIELALGEPAQPTEALIRAMTH